MVDAVGDRLELIWDGGITRGTHVLKALSVGAKACSGGRLYLYALAAAGEDGVARAIALLRSEEHTSELQSLMRISYAVFCLKKKNQRSHSDAIHDTLDLLHLIIKETQSVPTTTSMTPPV